MKIPTLALTSVVVGISLFTTISLCAQARAAQLIPDSVVDRYMAKFESQELEATGQTSKVAAPWFDHEIPRLDLPDKRLEEMYYFRWYAFAKHLEKTPRGWVITEFLDHVPWAGKYNTISAAAGLQLREARWLRDQAVAEDYASFWSEAEAEPRRYSFPFADSVHAVTIVTGNTAFEQRLLPALIKNYGAWEAGHLGTNGLFWQVDDRDGMEYSGGGSGYRPTINSYMYGDATAISIIARASGQQKVASQYEEKAAQLALQIHTRLWDKSAGFYETEKLSSGFANTRELVGYLPWYFDLARPEDESAWLQINDSRGFRAPFGYTTTEQRSAKFMRPYAHECTWNGPVWPFATTQTLTALADLLNQRGTHVLPASTFLVGLRLYAKEQHQVLSDGNTIPWIDEDSDPDTGVWLARARLEAQHRPDQHRGRYYNHSGFADLVISGLIGIRAEAGESFTLAPLVDPSWAYYALESVPYHGHLLTVYFDLDGTRYHMGHGLTVLEDGEVVAHSTGGSVKVHLLTTQEAKK